MFQRLITNTTKYYYRFILLQVIEETLLLKEKSPSILMYQNLYNQLLDIKKKIIDEQLILSEDELYSRYTIGAIAVKNFSIEENEYAQKLSDVFGGAFEYYKMPEK